MWKFLNKTIMEFRKCFSRQASFEWFVVLLVGMMLRSDHLGVTSVIRELYLEPKHYETMLHFFRSSSFILEEIVMVWMSIVVHSQHLYLEGNMIIFIIDGIKKSKEGRRMPGVKKQHQESDNSSKAEYMHGHLFGVIGVLIGTPNKMFSLPLQATVQDGVTTIRNWVDKNGKKESHVVQLVRQVCIAGSWFRKESIVLMDRYFLSVPALIEWQSNNKHFQNALVHIVTKAKKTAVAWHKPIQKGGRGAPRKVGEKVKLMQLFTLNAEEFKTTTVLLYGKEQKLQYFCIDLLWGLGLYCELRFVLVKMGEVTSILACTNTSFSPEKIIRLYGYRFKIESSFKALNQTLHGLAYHFWSKYMPKLNRFAKTGDANPLDNIQDQNAKEHIIATLRATEVFVMLNCIALGLLQLVSLNFFDNKNFSLLRWLRTPSKTTPSEATIAVFMRKSIYSTFDFLSDFHILKIIKSKQSNDFQSHKSNSD